MIKLETHSHIFGGSHCAKADDDTFIKNYLSAGYEAVVITNHFVLKAFEKYNGETDKEKIDFYFSLYDNMKEKLNKVGIKAFIGSEISCSTGEEYMLYGFDRSLFYDNKLLFTLSQKELFRLAEKNNCFMYQTHPFRDRVKVLGNPNFMHGAESFNGHFHHVNNNEQADRFCEENNLIKMSGSDYHYADQPIYGGIYVPENIDTETQLVEYIFKNDFKLIEHEDEYFSSLIKYKKEKEQQCK